MRSLLTLVLVCSAAAAGHATIAVPAEFREIVADAALIVRGRLTDVRAVTTIDRSIESIGTIGVDSVLKGAADRFVSIRVPGGVVGRTRVVMVGAPALPPNEQAVFFLKRGADKFWRPVGLSMGIYRVHIDPRDAPGAHPGAGGARVDRVGRTGRARRLAPRTDGRRRVRIARPAGDGRPAGQARGRS